MFLVPTAELQEPMSVQLFNCKYILCDRNLSQVILILHFWLSLSCTRIDVRFVVEFTVSTFREGVGKYE
jgi:hypothetical protein